MARPFDPVGWVLDALATRKRFVHQISALKEDAEKLRQRLVEAQKAKADAERRLEDARADREALKTKIAQLKKDVERTTRQNALLADKITDLRQEIESLKQR